MLFLPEQAKEKISDTERSMKVMSHGKRKKMSFEELVELAQDFKISRSHSDRIVWFSQPQLTMPGRRDSGSGHLPEASYANSQQDKLKGNGRQQELRSFSNQRSRSTNRNIICNYCKRKGHIRRECWRAAKACLICGEKHSMESCPNYDPDYRSRSKSRPRERSPLN